MDDEKFVGTQKRKQEAFLDLPSLKLTVKHPLKIGRNPIQKRKPDRIQILFQFINFQWLQLLLVSGRVFPNQHRNRVKERESFKKRNFQVSSFATEIPSKQPRNCMISQAHLICQKHSRLFCANSFSALCVMTSKAPAFCWTPTPSTPLFSSWWFQPISKILVRLDHFPK